MDGAPGPLLTNLQHMGLLPLYSLLPYFVLPWFCLNLWDGITWLLVKPSIRVKHALASNSAMSVTRVSHLWRWGVSAVQ